MNKWSLFIGLIILSFFAVTIIYTADEYKNNEKIRDFEKTKKIINKLRFFNDKDETFDKIHKYYINLDRSTDRKESIEKEFEIYNVKNYERFPAVDGSKLDSLKEGEITGYKYSNDYPKLSKGELGASLSHLTAIKKAYEKGIDYVIILEDDVKFTLMPYWKKNLSEIIEEVPKDFDILLLTFQDFGKNKNNEDKIYKRPTNNSVQSSVCYLVSRRGMEKVHNLFFSDKTISFRKEDELTDAIIDRGIWNKMEIYYTQPHLFPLDSLKFNTTINGLNSDPEINIKPVSKTMRYYEPLFWDKLLKKTSTK